MNKEVTLRIPAIHWAGCASSVKRTLQHLPGVKVLGIDERSKVACFTFDDTLVRLDEIKASLAKAGFAPAQEKR